MNPIITIAIQAIEAVLPFAANLTTGSVQSVITLLEKIIPDSVQISGRDTDSEKEEKFAAFLDGNVQTLVTKAKTYSIQEVYNNSKNACATGKFTSP